MRGLPRLAALIGWLSSISPDGVENLAPDSQWQNLTFDPPMVMFSANQYPDGRRKDTVLNAEQTGWFVYNMVYLGRTTGQSWGRKVAGVRLVSEATGRPIGMGMAFVRQLAHIIVRLNN